MKEIVTIYATIERQQCKIIVTFLIVLTSSVMTVYSLLDRRDGDQAGSKQSTWSLSETSDLGVLP